MKGAFSIKSKKTPYQVALAWLADGITVELTHTQCKTGDLQALNDHHWMYHVFDMCLQRHKELEEEKKRVGRRSTLAAPLQQPDHMSSMPAKACARGSFAFVFQRQLQYQRARSWSLQICSRTP